MMETQKEKQVGIKVVGAVALVSLVVGLGISGSLDWLSHVRANLLGETSSPEVRPATDPKGLPDFVSLAKKLRPVVVNISTTQVSEGGQGLPGPLGEPLLGLAHG